MSLLGRISWMGMTLFSLLMMTAGALYPGGNRFDHQYPYYSFFGNFLCDLYDRVAYNQIQNPGRPVAIMGTYSLALALLAFWIQIPRLFEKEVRLGRYVRVFGVAAMLISFLVPTRLHDQSILIGAFLGLTAFVISIRALFKAREYALGQFGLFALLICVLNYLSFAFQVFPTTLPGIQKAALMAFLAWVVAGMMRLPSRRASAAPK